MAVVHDFIIFVFEEVFWSAHRHIQPVTLLKNPQQPVAGRVRRVEVFVRIVVREPAAAEVAKVRLAAETHHVVAAYGLLARRIARRARRAVPAQVLGRRLLLGRQLRRPPRPAHGKLAVPAGHAHAAECVRAVLTNSQALAARRQFVLAVTGFPFTRFAARVLTLIGRASPIAAARACVTCRALTPTARAVDHVLVQFKLRLAFQLDVTLDCRLFERDFKELVRSERVILLSTRRSAVRLLVRVCFATTGL
jgi:hypothetical protein